MAFYRYLLYSYGKQVLLEPGYILDDQCNAQGNKLRQSGKRFYDDKYKEHFDYLFESVGNWFGGMKEDPVRFFPSSFSASNSDFICEIFQINHQFGEDWARLTRDLLFDNEGSLKFKPELWNDIRKVILPTLIDQVRFTSCLPKDCINLVTQPSRSDTYPSHALNTPTKALTS